MGIEYTPEQQQVIEEHGRNLLVSAAAGSGKTAVLTERIVRMISDERKRTDIDRLLVVTFTNAAAAEMRERIGRAIEARLEESGENEHLQKQAALIHNAQITTIDSFCLFVIRNNFNDIGLDPGFRVADEGELRLLKQDVMKELLEKKFQEKEEGFLGCVEYFSIGNRDRGIEEHILRLYQFAESNPWPEEWLEERKADYDIRTPEELEASSFLQYGMEQVRRLAQDCLDRIRECIAICQQPDGPYMYGEMLEAEEEKLEKLAAVKGHQEGCLLFRGMTFGRLPSKKDDSVSPWKRTVVQEIRKGIKETLKAVCTRYFPVSPQKAVEYMQDSREAVCELVDLTLAFKRALDLKKREENIIDFGDMEHLALSILVKRGEKGGYEPTGTALDFRDFFEEILIDEYQDSNMVQELLLRSISGEDAGNFNRFMVGDVKQSIYRFRLARPEIFMEKYETYTPESDTCRRIDLHKNFRSREEVLKTVNLLFERIMGRELGGIVYDEKAALYPGAAYPEQESQVGSSPNITELLLIKKEEGTEEEESEADEGLPWDGGEGVENRRLSERQKEAYAVACRIRELVGAFPVTEGGKLRPARYKDIVILLRTNAGWDEDFKSILKEEGIPSHSASRTGYFAAREIQALLQLLRVLDNPQQDIPLYGVMKSFFGGFTDREAALVRALTGERKKKLYFCLKELAKEAEGRNCSCQEEMSGAESAGPEENGASGEAPEAERERLGRKAAAFLERLDGFRDKTVYMPIHELLQELAAGTGYMDYVSALPGGEQRRANVQMLLEKAAAFEKTSYYGLFHFVRYIEQLEKYEVDYGEANILDENADVVRIMSIHKSKGLEFPICFVCGLSKRFNMQDAGGKMIADVDMGIGVDYVDTLSRLQSKTLRKNVISEKMRLDSLGEELRVLYVALTRAREKLIMTGTISRPEKKLGLLLPAAMRRAGEDGRARLLYGELTGAGCYLDWILPAFARDRAFAPLWEEYGLDGPGAWAEESVLAVKILDEKDILTAKIREQAVAGAAQRRLEGRDFPVSLDEDLLAHMSDLFSWRYPHSNLADLYTKTTVSELKRTGEDEEERYSFRLYEEETVAPYIPKFMLEEEILGGAARGNAFHKVMELLDFGREGDVSGQIRRMVEEERLSREYAAAVSVPAIERFLDTGLARRMREAEGRGCLYREQPFVLGLPAHELNEKFPSQELVLIQGIIDVYFEEDGELVVADYKTDRVSAPQELTDRYRKQLEYYERALVQITGKRVKERVIYSFGLGQEILL